MLTFNWLGKLHQQLRSPARPRRHSRATIPTMCHVERLEQRQLLSASAVGDEAQVNSYTTGNQQTNSTGQGGSVAMDSQGNYVVVWSSAAQDGSGTGIYGQLYSASGTPLGSEFPINTTTANDQSNPSASMNASGAFVVTWTSTNQDGSGTGVYAQLYSADGVAQGSEFKVNTTTSGNQYNSTVAMNSTGNFVIAWQSASQDGSGSGIYAQRYNSTGVAQGSEFRVNTTTANDQTNPSVAINSTGTFVVAWQSASQDGSGNGIYAQRYNSSGVVQGSEFRVNTTTANDQTLPHAAIDTTGNFVVAWQSNLQDGGGYGIFAQRYNSAGTAQGSEFRVNATTTGDQSNSSIAMTTTGFAILWQSAAQDGSGLGIYGQQYNTAGVAQGGEFRVNTTTSGDQNYASVAMDANGNFAAAWTSANQDGNGTGVFAQRFNSPVSLTGTTLTVTGSGFDNTITITEGVNLTVTVDGVAYNYTPGSVTAINVSGLNGNDTITVTSLGTGKTLTLNGNAGNDTLTVSGAITNAATLNGGDGNDTLVGGGGNDALNGGEGNDTYVFDTDLALGTDTINESLGGADTLDFSSTTTRGVTINLGTSTAQVVNAGLTLNLTANNTMENVIGSTQADTISGNSIDNILTGGAGNDTYIFDADPISGLGSDVINESGGGIDTLDFSSTSTRSITIDLSDASAQIVNSALTLTLSAGNTIENVNGGAIADTITGNSLNNTLSGGAGNDKYLFNTDLALGSDTVNDTAGVDTLDFSGTATRNVTIDLSSTSAQTVNAGLTLTLGAGNIFENVVGGDANDSITGNSLNNLLNGGEGNDTYFFDTDLALGTDTINESSGGTDTLNFSATTTRNVAVNLAASGAQVVNAGLTLTLSSGITMENLVGGTLNDTFTGNTLNNVLTGGAGNDTYMFDTDAVQGSDTINESGGGIDTLNFSGTSTQTVTVNLATASAQVVNSALTLTLSAGNTMENVVGGTMADSLTGNSLDNTLQGGGGNDTYYFDTDLALGSDTISDSGGTDTVDFSGTTSRAVNINLSNLAAQVVNAGLTLTLSSNTIENVVGGTGNDVITGNSLNNVLAGGAGNDTYILDTDVANGNDTINEAGGGNDTLDFSSTTTRNVAVDLSKTSLQSVNAGLNLVLTSGNSIENVIGGSLNDTLTGNALDNVLTGGSGNDTYVFDTDIISGLGSDTINESGGGVDTLDFSTTTSRSVTVDLSNAGAQVVNSALTLTLSSSTTIENVTGGTLADTLTGNTLNNVLTGGAGADTYVYDTDVAHGSDTINEAGGGIDTLDFSGTTSRAVNINLATTTAQVVNAGLTLTLGAPTIENVIGGALGDTISGNSLNNSLNGGAGNDTYVFDTDVAQGSDTINESGGGIDTLDFSGTTARNVSINLSNAGSQSVNAGLTLTLSSATTIENVVGGSLHDTITGNALNNVLTGGAGNDLYMFDTDTALGDDTIVDASGVDTLNFSGTTTRGVVADLSNAGSQVINAGLTLTLSTNNSIENVIGGTQSDTLIGNSLDNALTGGSGNDTYIFDTDLSLGSDTINESAGGTDTLDLSGTTTRNVSVNLANASAQVVNAGLTLTLSSASTIENVIGGSLDDTLTGNSLANTLTGGAGDDALTGAAGNDTYLFDTDIAQGSDQISDSGGGADALDFSQTTTQNITIDLSNGAAQVVNSNLTLTLSSGGAMENVIGGALNDRITGNSLSNTLTGGAGNDTYIFDTDTISGNDTINETGGGIDTLDFSATTTRAVSVNLSNGAAQVVNSGLTLTLQSGNTIENIIGGAAGNTLTGNSLNNVLTGGVGNDSYMINTELDQGADTINDAGGIDTLNFSATTTRDVNVDLSLATAQIVNSNLTLTLASGGIMENVIGGGGNDTLTGNALNNVMTGGGGNDALAGGAGNDAYLFDADLALGSDSIVDTAGTDTLDFSQTTTRNVAIDISKGTSQVVNAGLSLTLSSGSSLENIVGGALHDTLTGNSLNNTLTGGAGNDTYVFDTDMALGSDTIIETGGVDTVDFSGTTARSVVIDLSKPTAQVINAGLTLNLSSAAGIENVIGGAMNDTLTGNSMSNAITGGGGNDTLTGGGSNDVYIFDGDLALGSDVINESGGGIDTLDFSSTTTRGVTVNLATPTAQAVNAGLTLTLSSASTIENAIGGAMDDTLTGNALANVLVGGAGNDTLMGAAGNNILIGGAGTDTLRGGANDDLIIAGSYVNETIASSLVLLRNEWTSGTVFDTKVAHLQGTLPGGANGSSTFLNSTTVQEDGVADSLEGSSGHDWYFLNEDGAIALNRDSVVDADIDSLFTEISSWL